MGHRVATQRTYYDQRSIVAVANEGLNALSPVSLYSVLSHLVRDLTWYVNFVFFKGLMSWGTSNFYKNIRKLALCLNLT